MINAVVVSLAMLSFGGGRSSSPPPEEPATEPGAMRALLPGVLVGEGVVEFRGVVCADLSHPQTPVVYLELLVTGPDSREHESLVVTRVTPSAIHAGLLAAGLEPGHPVRWEGQRVKALATGDRVRVTVAMVDVGDDQAADEFVDLASWAVRQGTDTRLDTAEGWGLVFAGSVLDEAAGVYSADQTGTVVGLTGFGTEVVAAAWDLSPEASVNEPVWIADKQRTPAVGTPVRIRVSRVDPPADSGQSGEDSVDTPSVEQRPAGGAATDDPS